MTDYFTEIAGPTIGPILGLALTFALIALALWVAFLIVRRFRGGLFISGGQKGRLPRLAVTDAVPVDSSRRLILVRRDDVEHLILIGGPTDLVVETGIGKAQPAAQPAPRLPAQATQPQMLPPQRAPVQAARDAVADAERGRPVRVPEAQLSERRTELPSAPPPVATAPAPPVRTNSSVDLDKLLDELRPNPLQDQ